MNPIPGQLTIDDVLRMVDEDDLADLDIAHAREVLEAEAAEAARTATCQCRRRSAFLIDEFGVMHCTKCGRSW